jgi:hypothetical protein
MSTERNLNVEYLDVFLMEMLDDLDLHGGIVDLSLLGIYKEGFLKCIETLKVAFDEAAKESNGHAKWFDIINNMEDIIDNDIYQIPKRMTLSSTART